MNLNKKFAAVVGCLAIVVLAISLIVYANINYAQEGTVRVVTRWGGIERVYTPADGWFTTLAPGRTAYAVTVRSFTEKAMTRVTSKDNAALQVEVAVTAHTEAQQDRVAEYVRKFGFSEEERHRRRNEILGGLIQTEARNAFAEYPAYEIYANQEAIQKRIVESLRPLLSEQLLLVMESAQIGNPDFLDDRIEQAASAVVANEKQKQAEQAKLEAAKITALTKEIEARTYANPALLDIKKLELQLEIERVRSEGIKGHQGALTIVQGSGAGVQLQVPTRP
ncbi:MAG TPA: SPFH domain-containing protein [Blastocatellia bacterium]|nr:SPFH domain-containing protein [Blastocatellia bacterium]